MTEALENSSSNLKKFFLLALSFYLILVCFPFPLTYIPNSIETLEWMNQPIDSFSYWFGKSVLRISALGTADMYSTGDSLFEYVKLVSLPVLSLLLSAVVFVFSYSKTDYKKLYKWTIVYLRYTIGADLFIMGFALLFSYSNYYSMDAHKLLQPVGDFTPDYLFWTFMGFSKGYIFFCGISQVIIGFLFFFRKTTTFAAFLAIIFFINIVAYSFAYNFTNKLSAMHMLLFSIIVLGPNIKTVFNFFRGKTTALKPYTISLVSKEIHVMRIIAKCSFITLLLIHELTRIENIRPVQPLKGVYKTIQFFRNGDTLQNDLIFFKKKNMYEGWDKLVIDKGYAAIHTKGTFGGAADMAIEVDTAKHTFELFTFYDSTRRFKFEYKENFTDYGAFLNISGIYVNDTIEARFRKKWINEFPLMYDKFRWIAE